VLMLAERSAEHISFFEENREIVCFEGVHELGDKIDYYLTHDGERQAIAQAGYEKVTKGGNSYLDRMRDVLKVYYAIAERRGLGKVAT
jgi:spore maturation protein CgeB